MCVYIYIYIHTHKGLPLQLGHARPRPRHDARHRGALLLGYLSLYIYIYICMYVCMYVYIYIYIYTFIIIIIMPYCMYRPFRFGCFPFPVLPFWRFAVSDYVCSLMSLFPFCRFSQHTVSEIPFSVSRAALRPIPVLTLWISEGLTQT